MSESFNQESHGFEPTQQPSGAAPAVEKHKLHHSYIWLSGLQAIPYIFGVALVSIVPSLAPLLSNLGLMTFTILTTALAVILVTAFIYGVCVVIAAVSYRFIWYEFAPGEFKYYSGILNKKRNHIPYQRVQSVNQKMSLFQRLAGVCTVEIDTAGGSSNTAIRIKYIKREEAERIRREVFMRKQLLDSGLTAQQAHEEMLRMGSGVRVPVAQPPVGVPVPAMAPAPPASTAPGPAVPASTTPASTPGPGQPAVPFAQDAHSNVLDAPAEFASEVRGVFGGYEVDTGKVTYEIGLSNKELVLSAITGKTSFALVLIGVVTAIFSAVSSLSEAQIPGSAEMVTFAQGLFESSLVAVGTPVFIAFAAFAVLGFLVLIWVLSLVSTCLSYGGFKARRRDDRVEVEHGILSHTFSGMDIARIQGITIKQSFFQRLLGYCSLSYGRVTAAESDQENTSSSMATVQDTLVVHPFLKVNRVDEVVHALTPEFSECPEVDRKLPRRALRRALTRRVILQGMGFWFAVMVSASWLGLSLVPDGFWISEGVAPQAAHDVIRNTCLLLYALFVIIAVVEVINAVLWYKGSGFGFNRRYVILVNGGFSTDTVVVFRQKIQMAYAGTNPLQRLAKVATITAVTAQGSSSKKEQLVDVAAEDANAWLEWSIPRVAR